MLFSGINRVQMAYGVYGYRRTNGTIHKGIDVDTPGGDVRIYATTAGRVEYAGMVPKGADRTWEWGWHVRVIDGAGKRHVYAHCEAGSLQVAAGQSVAAGQPLARMGNSGNAAANVPPYKHVHYQVDVRAGGAWQAVDPAPFAGIQNRVGETPNPQGGSGMKELTVTVLEVFGDKNCQYFHSMNVDDIAGNRMAAGQYLVTASGGSAGGFAFCKAIVADRREYYVALVEDRSVLRQLPAAEAARLLGGGAGAGQEGDSLLRAIAQQSETIARYSDALQAIKKALAALGGEEGGK